MVLNLLQAVLSEHTVWIACTGNIGNAPSALPALEMLRFHEQTLPYNILFPPLEALSGNTDSGKWLTFDQLLQKNRWPATIIHNLTQPGLLLQAEEFAPDLCISVRFGKIFKGPWLRLAPKGILNLHSGLLPEYRGILATFWTLLQQRDEYGCTLHWVEDECIDTGQIIETIRLPVKPEKSLFSHIVALYEPGAAKIAQAITQLSNGKSLAREVQQGKHQYFSWPQQEDCQRFLAQGRKFIDYEDYTSLLARWSAHIR